MNRRFSRRALIPFFAVVLVVWLASTMLIAKPAVEGDQGFRTYSQLVSDARAGGHSPRLYEVVFDPSKRAITATLGTAASHSTSVTVHYPSDESALQLQNLLEKDAPQVLYDSKGTGGFSWASVLVDFLPILLLVGFWVFMMRQMKTASGGYRSAKITAEAALSDSPRSGSGTSQVWMKPVEAREIEVLGSKVQALGARIPKVCCSTGYRTGRAAAHDLEAEPK